MKIRDNNKKQHDTTMTSKVVLRIFIAIFFALFLGFICFDAVMAADDTSLSVGGGVFLMFAPTPILNGSSGMSVGDTPTGGMLCYVVATMLSGTGRGIAVLSIIFLGIGALFGKIRWEQAVMLGVGIAIFFGAASLINSLPNYNTDDETIKTKGITATLDKDGSVDTCS